MKNYQRASLLFFLALSIIFLIPGCDMGNESNDTIDTPVATYTLGGTVSGLQAGESCTVYSCVNNMTVDHLLIEADGPFTFPTEIADGKSYGVIVTDSLANKRCVTQYSSGIIMGAAVKNVAVTSQDISNIQISGTVEDAVTDVMLQGIEVIVTRPSHDSISKSCTTDENGAFVLTVQKGDDFYLHAQVPSYPSDPNDVPTINGKAYIPCNVQIQNETADRTGIKIYMVDTETVATRASDLNFDMAKDAVFSLDIEDDNSDGIAEVTATASPELSRIFYGQADGGLIETAPTTSDGSILGILSAPAYAGTYSITLSGATDNMTVDKKFQLRLIRGNLSQAIEP